MNLVTGKVIKGTHFFDEQSKPNQVKLVKALATEPAERELKDNQLIENYVRSISVFKPYKSFLSSDFAPIVQEMKLHKFQRGTRVCEFGKNSDNIYVILQGRLCITHPNQLLKSLIESRDEEYIKDRIEIMTERMIRATKRMETYKTK